MYTDKYRPNVIIVYNATICYPVSCETRPNECMVKQIDFAIERISHLQRFNEKNNNNR